MAKINPQPYEWDFDGNCAPTGKYNYGNITFSLGIFQWVPKSNGVGLKRAKVKYRVRGYKNNPEEVYTKAKAKCKELNKILSSIG